MLSKDACVKGLFAVAIAALGAGCEATDRGIASPYEARPFSQIKINDNVKISVFSLRDPSTERVVIEGHDDGSLTRDGKVVGHVIGNAVYDADWHRLATVNNNDDIHIRGTTWRLFGGGGVAPWGVPQPQTGDKPPIELGPPTTTMIGPEEGKRWIVRMSANGYFSVAAWDGDNYRALGIHAKGYGTHLAETAMILATTFLLTDGRTQEPTPSSASASPPTATR